MDAKLLSQNQYHLFRVSSPVARDPSEPIPMTQYTVMLSLENATHVCSANTLAEIVKQIPASELGQSHHVVIHVPVTLTQLL